MSKNSITILNRIDKDGNPTGGSAYGKGLAIQWQRGPLGRGDDRKEPNGAFVEDLLVVAKRRLDFYQGASEGRFSCPENAEAISHIQKAIEALESRTKRREEAGIEGTHRGN